MSALVILGTTTHALTGTAYSFVPDEGVADSNALDNPQSWRVRVFADIPFNLKVSTDGSAATSADTPIAAELHGLTVVVPPGGSISVVKRGSSSDGNVWFTRVKWAS